MRSTTVPTSPDSRPLRTRRADTIAIRRMRWLWRDWLPRGKLVVLDGDPGVGKSTLLADLVARLTTGQELPDGSRHKRRIRCLVVSSEECAEDTISPRLKAHGADLTKVEILDEELIDLQRDLVRLQRVIVAEGIELVIIDPLFAHLGNLDGHRDQEVRKALTPLARMAEHTGATVICVRHLNKGAGDKALYRGGGSIGIIAAARIGLLVATDPTDGNRLVLTVQKTNVGAKPTSLLYQLVSDEALGCGRIHWLGSTPLTDADLLVHTAPATKVDKAEVLLRDLLAGGRRIRQREIRREATARNISWRTVESAKQRIGVRSEQVRRPGEKSRGSSWWFLPEGSSQSLDDWSATSNPTKFADHSQEADALTKPSPRRFKTSRGYVPDRQDGES